MIQRKQTLFLLLAVAALVACLCLPVAVIEPRGMGMPTLWYNAGMVTDGAFRLQPVLFADLTVAAMLAFASIFLYRKRRTQARLCTVGTLLCPAWYAWYGYVMLGGDPDGGTFHVAFAACLPLVACILLLMARRGILADERLVRSMDRIR